MAIIVVRKEGGGRIGVGREKGGKKKEEKEKKKKTNFFFFKKNLNHMLGLWASPFVGQATKQSQRFSFLESRKVSAVTSVLLGRKNKREKE